MEEECSRRGNSICRGLQVEKRKMTQRKRNNSVWEDSSGPSPSRTGKSSPATASGALALGFLPSPAAAEGASPRSGGGLPPSSVQVTRAPPPRRGRHLGAPFPAASSSSPDPAPQRLLSSQDLCRGGGGRCRVCLCAPPGAVSVTPAPRPNPVQPVFVRKVLLETASPFR